MRRKEFVLSKQILRSGTSIGALIREAEYGQSKTDFIHKMTIALKEANETEYWINILKDTNYIEEKLFKSLAEDCNELIKLLIASIKTAKQNLQKLKMNENLISLFINHYSFKMSKYDTHTRRSLRSKHAVA